MRADFLSCFPRFRASRAEKCRDLDLCLKSMHKFCGDLRRFAENTSFLLKFLKIRKTAKIKSEFSARDVSYGSAPDKPDHCKPDHRVDQKTAFSEQKPIPCRELEGRSPSAVAGGVGGGSPPPRVAAFGLGGSLRAT